MLCIFLHAQLGSRETEGERKKEVEELKQICRGHKGTYIDGERKKQKKQKGQDKI